MNFPNEKKKISTALGTIWPNAEKIPEIKMLNYQILI